MRPSTDQYWSGEVIRLATVTSPVTRSAYARANGPRSFCLTLEEDFADGNGGDHCERAVVNRAEEVLALEEPEDGVEGAQDDVSGERAPESGAREGQRAILGLDEGVALGRGVDVTGGVVGGVGYE